MERKNINRGYKKLIVWQDAIELYVLAAKVLSVLPFESKEVGSNILDACHSISRNIAEGYCRKSLKEYLRYLDIAMGSSGEFHSSIYAMEKAKQISIEEFENMDVLHYKLENGLIKLVQSLQEKLKNNDWNDSLLNNNP